MVPILVTLLAGAATPHGAVPERASPEALWKSAALAGPYREALGEDERIGGLSRVWAEAKFGFANFDLVEGLDWDAAYLETLPDVRRALDTTSYYRVLRRFVARLGDGHTSIVPPTELVDEFYARPLVLTRLVGDRVLVVGLRDQALRKRGVAEGLELTAVDGIPVRRYAEEQVRPYVSASTPQDREVKVYGTWLLAGSAREAVTLTLRDAAGRVSEVKLERAPWARVREAAARVPLVTVARLAGGLAHVAVTSFNDPKAAERFDEVLETVRDAPGLVLDLRDNGGGNSDVGYRILGRLTDKAFKTSRWRTRRYEPAVRAWSQPEAWRDEAAEDVPPGEGKPYLGPVALLVSSRTYSAAEDFTVAFDQSGRGPILGEPTGGSTGQPLRVNLPGGGAVQICSKRDTYADDRPFVGVGIAPAETIRPTVEDVRSGRDPVLEAAVRRLSVSLGPAPPARPAPPGP